MQELLKRCNYCKCDKCVIDSITTCGEVRTPKRNVQPVSKRPVKYYSVRCTFCQACGPKCESIDFAINGWNYCNANDGELIAHLKNQLCELIDKSMIINFDKEQDVSCNLVIVSEQRWNNLRLTLCELKK